MSASVIRSIRAKSLLIDFLLTSVRLPHGDDAGGLAARRMGYHDQASGEEAQSDQPFLSIIETVVLEGDTRSGKYLFGVLKSQTVLGEVATVLRFVPSVSHP